MDLKWTVFDISELENQIPKSRQTIIEVFKQRNHAIQFLFGIRWNCIGCCRCRHCVCVCLLFSILLPSMDGKCGSYKNTWRNGVLWKALWDNVRLIWHHRLKSVRIRGWWRDGDGEEWEKKRAHNVKRKLSSGNFLSYYDCLHCFILVWWQKFCPPLYHYRHRIMP